MSRLSCAEAFQMITERSRRDLSEPPIVDVCSDDDYSSIIVDEISLGDESEENETESVLIFSSLSLEAQRSFHALEDVANHISDRISGMFPRLIYDQSVDGLLLWNFTSLATDTVIAVERMRRGTQGHLAKLTRRSPAIRKYAWYVSMILNQIASVQMNETEIYMIAAAPWVHAFMFATYHIQFLYPAMYTGNVWSFLAMSKYNPQYDKRGNVAWYFYIPPDTTNAFNEVMFQRHSFVDWETVEDVTLSCTSTDMHATQLIRPDWDSLKTKLMNIIGHFFSVLHLSDERSRRITLRALSAIQVLVYAMESRLLDDPGATMRPQLTEEEISVIIRCIRSLQTFVEIYDSTISAMIRLFSSSMSPEIRFKIWRQSALVRTRIPLGNSRMRISRELNETVEYINEMGLYDLSSIHAMEIPPGMFSMPAQLHQVSRHLLESLLHPSRDLVILVNTSSNHSVESAHYIVNPLYADTRIEEQIAIGRLLGAMIETPFAKTILSDILIGSSTIHQTLFFNSFHVRKGFNDATIGSNIEEFFTTGFELIEALNAVE